MDSKSDSEKEKLIQEAMTNVFKVRENLKRRTLEIERNQRLRLEKSICQAEAAVNRHLQRLEKYSKKLFYFVLWKSEQEVDSALSEIPSQKGKNWKP